MRRLWVVCYDVADHRLRRQVERILLGVGVRVQLSVFECWLTPDEYHRLVARIKPLTLGVRDSLRFYHLCHWCVQGVRWLGPGHAPEEPRYWVC